MSSSDQSDDDIYLSDEEITSFLHMHNSSSDEALDEKEERKCTGRGLDYLETQGDFIKILSTKPHCLPTTPSEPAQQLGLKFHFDESDESLGKSSLISLSKDGETGDTASQNSFQSQIFEFQVPFTSHIKLRLMDLMKQTGAAAYISPSFMRDWNISLEVPPEVICDACIFSDTKPVSLLTFHQGGETDVILRYNAKITRYFVFKVRKGCHSNFTSLSGVFDEADCNTEESFITKMQKLETEARKKFVPNWLHVDRARCSQFVEIFLKMGQKCGKQWLDVSDSLIELRKSVTSTSKETYTSDTKTVENGCAGHQVNGNEETVTSTTKNFDKNTVENGFAGYRVDSTVLDVGPSIILKCGNIRQSSNIRRNMSSNPEIEDNLTIALEILETRKLKESRIKDLETSTKICPMSPMTHV